MKNNQIMIQMEKPLKDTPINVHVMRYDEKFKKLVNTGGFQYLGSTNEHNQIVITLPNNEKHHTGDSNYLQIPKGSILRVEINGRSMMIEDMLDLNPTKNVKIFKKHWPNSNETNIANCVQKDDMYSITLKNAEDGTLELVEIESKEDPAKVVQRKTLETNPNTITYVFQPVTMVNAGSNFIAIRWIEREHDDPAGVFYVVNGTNISPIINITDITMEEDYLVVHIAKKMDSSAITASKSNIHFTGEEDTLILTGTNENRTNGTSLVKIPRSDAVLLSKFKKEVNCNVYLVGESNKSEPYKYDPSKHKTNYTDVEMDSNDFVWSEHGDELRCTVKFPKNSPTPNIHVERLENEYVSGKIFFEYKKEENKKTTDDKHDIYTLTIRKIRTIPEEHLQDTKVIVSIQEGNKLPILEESKKIVQEGGKEKPEDSCKHKPMTDVSLEIDDMKNFHLKMKGPYPIVGNEVYKIRDIIIHNADQYAYVHPETVIVKSDQINIPLYCNLDIGNFDRVTYRYSYGNKVFSVIQDYDCPTLYREKIESMSETIINSKLDIVEDCITIPKNIPFPDSITVKKVINGESHVFQSVRFDKKTRKFYLEYGALQNTHSEEEEVYGFTSEITLHYANVIHKVHNQKIKYDIIHLDKEQAFGCKWHIDDPESVYGEFTKYNGTDDIQRMINDKLLRIFTGAVYTENDSSIDNNPFMIPTKMTETANIIKDLMKAKNETLSAAWMSQVTISPSDSKYLPKLSCKYIQFEIQYKLHGELKKIYCRMDKISQTDKSITFGSPKLVLENGIPTTWFEQKVIHDSIMLGLPLHLPDGSKIKEFYDSLKKQEFSTYNSYLSVTHIPFNTLRVENQKWNNHSQIIPFTFLIDDMTEEGKRAELYHDKIFSMSYSNGDFSIDNMKDGDYTYSGNQVGVILTPTLHFVGSQQVTLRSRKFNLKLLREQFVKDTISKEIGIVNLPDVEYVSVSNSDGLKSFIGMNQVKSTFRFGNNFTELHFDDAILPIPQYLSDNIISYKQLHRKSLKTKLEDQEIESMKILFIGDAVTVENKRSVIPKIPDNIKEAKITYNNTNSSDINIGINKELNATEYGRTEKRKYYSLDLYHSYFWKRNHDNETLGSSMWDVYSGKPYHFFNDTIMKRNRYTSPLVYVSGYGRKNEYHNLENNGWFYETREYKRDMTRYASIQYVGEDSFEQFELVAKYGKSDNKDIDKVFHNSAILTDHYYFKRMDNKPIINISKYQSTSQELVIKYQIKIKGSPDYIRDPFVFYFPSDLIADPKNITEDQKFTVYDGEITDSNIQMEVEKTGNVIISGKEGRHFRREDIQMRSLLVTKEKLEMLSTLDLHGKMDHFIKNMLQITEGKQEDYAITFTPNSVREEALNVVRENMDSNLFKMIEEIQPSAYAGSVSYELAPRQDRSVLTRTPYVTSSKFNSLRHTPKILTYGSNKMSFNYNKFIGNCVSVFNTTAYQNRYLDRYDSEDYYKPLFYYLLKYNPDSLNVKYMTDIDIGNSKSKFYLISDAIIKPMATYRMSLEELVRKPQRVVGISKEPIELFTKEQLEKPLDQFICDELLRYIQFYSFPKKEIEDSSSTGQYKKKRYDIKWGIQLPNYFMLRQVMNKLGSNAELEYTYELDAYFRMNLNKLININHNDKGSVLSSSTSIKMVIKETDQILDLRTLYGDDMIIGFGVSLDAMYINTTGSEFLNHFNTNTSVIVTIEDNKSWHDVHELTIAEDFPPPKIATTNPEIARFIETATLASLLDNGGIYYVHIDLGLKNLKTSRQIINELFVPTKLQIKFKKDENSNEFHIITFDQLHETAKNLRDENSLALVNHIDFYYPSVFSSEFLKSQISKELISNVCANPGTYELEIRLFGNGISEFNIEIPFIRRGEFLNKLYQILEQVISNSYKN